MMRTGGGLIGIGLGIAAIAGAHVSMGGGLGIFAQPAALAIVFGGTLAALLVSFPMGALAGAAQGVADLHQRPSIALDQLVPTFVAYARKARKHGLMAVEDDIERAGDPFLQRALSLSVSGLPAPVVRDALDLEARVYAEREEDQAQVLEAAAGYAPTLGIVGAVVGLMHVMQDFSGPESVGAGMAAAFVATIYGVGVANLVFLPLATRLRRRARLDALRRDLMIDGVLALRDGASPGVVEERLAGYLSLRQDRPSVVSGVA
jgi:chemotaxis protein MotA